MRRLQPGTRHASRATAAVAELLHYNEQRQAPGDIVTLVDSVVGFDGQYTSLAERGLM